MSALTLSPTSDLSALRRSRGLSQQRVAELAGCSLSMVRQLERGYRPTSGDTLRRVVDVLNDESQGGHPGSHRPSAPGVEVAHGASG